jgi:hypothetical protein
VKQADLLEALAPVTRALTTLNIPYYIGGSVASSLYGIARATLDVDIAARIEHRHFEALRDSLRGMYYLDEDMIIEAIERRSSFNLIHLETSVKIDVFVPGDEPYQQAAMGRKRKDTLLEGEQEVEFPVSSPEDIILNKLVWYESGGRVSERQWLDVAGVIKVQRDSLDTAYLARWAKELDVSSLLIRAFAEAGVAFPESSGS